MMTTTDVLRPRQQGVCLRCAEWMRCKAGQDVAEVVAHWDSEAAAAFDYRGIAATRQPCLSALALGPRPNPRFSFPFSENHGGQKLSTPRRRSIWLLGQSSAS
jgi:hypothetical protein